MRRELLGALCCLAAIVSPARGAVPRGAPATGAQVQARISADAAAGRAIVVHVIVALADNAHQGIVPVPARLGNGRDPASNLYWGALYGVRSYLPRRAGWSQARSVRPPDARILERAVFFDRIARAGGSTASVYLVADAWDGAEIRAAISRFLEMSAGRAVETVSVAGPAAVEVRAGGAAHLIAFVGHDGLMDFTVPFVEADPAAPPQSAIVLACASRSHFTEHLRRAGAHPLVVTTGLMAPEAYTLDATIRSWIRGESAARSRDAAAAAYDRYQHCGPRAAKSLFAGEP